MTVRLEGDAIVIDGVSPVEDAEVLLGTLQAHPGTLVDCSRCASMHTAVVQVLMAANATFRGACGDDFVRLWTGIGDG